jgi:hypothetical protein
MNQKQQKFKKHRVFIFLFFVFEDFDWIHHKSEIFIYTHKKIKFDVVFFLLVFIFKNDVFDEINSSIQLWRQRVSENDVVFELRMKRSKFWLSMLKIITRIDELSDRMLNDSTFRYYFQRIVFNAEYYDTLTIHVLRRIFANVVDNEIFHLFFSFYSF